MIVRYFVPLCAAIAAPAAAEPMRFDAALERAAVNAPILDARASQTEARRSAEIAAGALPDPTLGVGLDNFPVSGPPAFSLTRETMTMERISLEQAVPNLAKRRAQKELARADTSIARAHTENELRRVTVATALAWIDTYFAQRRLEAIDTILSRLDRLRGPSTAAVASGTARPAHSLAIAQELARLADRRSTILAEHGSAIAQLVRWTGIANPEPTGDLPLFDVSAETLRSALAEHPAMSLAAADRGRALAGVDAARAELRPDWGFGVNFQRRDPAFGSMASVGATMTLPLFTDRRQTPRIAAAAADAAAARAANEDVRRALEAELDTALAEHDMHHAQWRRARDILLPLAQQEAALETASYGAGRAGLIDVIGAEVRLAETELDTLDRQAALARHEAQLALGFGEAL